MDEISLFMDDNHFLSNFAISPIELFDVIFPTAEHAYQYAKTLDPVWQKEILNAPSAGKAKRLGAKCPMRDDWEDIKLEVMERVLLIKFSIPYFRDQLLNTGDKTLVEGNGRHDNVWGNCTCDDCQFVKGQNKLGIILMNVRSKFKELKSSILE